MTRFIKPICQEYVTADLQPRGVDIKLDIEALDLKDSRFEIVVCSHVLEHVDDRRALSELYRVITPSGFALLMFPVVEGWATTYEDFIQDNGGGKVATLWPGRPRPTIWL